MNFPFYKGDGIRQQQSLVNLPVSQRSHLLKPESYIVDPGLRDACNVSLLLGQPLLISGEPGIGKTQFAYSLAWELGLSPPLKFETKSTSVARDLFYTYDALRRFQDVQSGVNTDILNYISYQALGVAILRTRKPDQVRHILPSDYQHTNQTRSVVVIDEIDKAARDFPNDLLNELEHMYFRIPEMGNEKIESEPALYPIVIITSNSEKDLPDAFLRRCIYYNLPFPEAKILENIIVRHLGSYVADQDVFLKSALDLFYILRAPQSGLRKKPTTAELLSWILSLHSLGGNLLSTLNNRGTVFLTLSSLTKTAEDQTKAKQIIEKWIRERTISSTLG